MVKGKRCTTQNSLIRCKKKLNKYSVLDRDASATREFLRRHCRVEGIPGEDLVIGEQYIWLDGELEDILEIRAIREEKT